MRRLEPAGHVTRFVTRTLCHVVIPSESGETRAALVRWSAGTLAVRTGLCETTACRLITQRLLVPVDASRDQHHKSPRTCRDVVSDTCPNWILACFACRFCSQTEWPTRKLGRLRSRASRSTTTPPKPSPWTAPGPGGGMGHQIYHPGEHQHCCSTTAAPTPSGSSRSPDPCWPSTCRHQVTARALCIQTVG